MAVILRSEKGAPLTHGEMDGNFTVARNNATEVGALESDVGVLQTDLGAAEADVATLQSDVTSIQSDVGTLQADVLSLQGSVSFLQSELSTAQADIVDLQSGVLSLLNAVSALQATVPIGELIVPAAWMTAKGNAVVTANPSGHPVVQLPNSGVNEISSTLIHVPPSLRGINLTATAYFDVEDLGGQVRLTWDIHDAGTAPSVSSFNVTIGPSPTTLNPQVLTTTLQLTGTGPASMADFLIRRDSGSAFDTYTGTLDFYMLRLEPT